MRRAAATGTSGIRANGRGPIRFDESPRGHLSDLEMRRYQIGLKRDDVRHRMVGETLVQYTVDVKDHLVQIGDRSTSSRP